MSDTYFKFFPKIIDENDNEVLDLLTHVFPVNIEQLKLKSLESVILSDNDYAERVAHVFYQDPHLFYPLFLINDIVDPFNEWVIQESELTNCIYDKYRDRFLQKHQNRFIAQFKRFFQQRFFFGLSHLLPMGNYVLRLYFGDRRMASSIFLSMNYANKPVEVDLIDHLPYLAMQDGQSTVDFYLGNTTSKLTKIHIKQPSHLKLRIRPIEAKATVHTALLSSKRTKVTIPFEGEIVVSSNEDVFLEFDISTTQPIYIHGTGTHVVAELYNSSAYLIQKVFSKTNQSMQQIVEEILKFSASVEFDFENDHLYRYSESLLKTILNDVLNQIMESNRIEMSVWRLFKTIIDEYKTRFNPQMFTEQASLKQANLLRNRSIKVLCAAQHDINIQLPIIEIDGVRLHPFKRVLLVNQKNVDESGIYLVNGNFALVKTDDSLRGSLIVVEQGAILKGTQWIYNDLRKIFQRTHHQNIENASTLESLEKIMEGNWFHFYQQDILNDTHHYELTDSGVVIDDERITDLPVEAYKRVSNLEYETQQNDRQRKKLTLLPVHMSQFVRQYRNFLMGERKIEHSD